MTLDDIFDEVATLHAAILDSCTPHPATDYGLDKRCGTIYANEEYLATENRRSLDYYGGFEYVDPACVIELNGLTLYSTEDSRVLTALQTLEHNHD